jgi:hypothetical protein
MIVDYFPFFSPYGQEIAELRILILKNYVDYFVICESNKTQSGEPVKREFLEIAKKRNFPLEKIIYIELDIPEANDLKIEEIDILNTYEIVGNEYKPSIFTNNIENQKARTRERLQKDALMSVLDKFQDDTIFIHSDQDEIINPIHLKYLSDVCKQNEDMVIKIPLILCEAKADLRVYWKNSSKAVDWSGGMFMTTKKTLLKTTPTKIRSNNLNTINFSYITENGKRVEDLGWHFSWMGDENKKEIKRKNWAHYKDKLESNEYDYSSNEYEEHIKSEFTDGSKPPSGFHEYELRKIPHEMLPKEIFENKHLKSYFIGDSKNFYVLKQPSKKRIFVVDDFYEYPEAIRAFALSQEFIEGGFGKGYIGIRSVNQFLFPGLKERFEDIMGQKIVAWEEHGMNGRFQTCIAGDPLVFHCDTQKWAAMIYLTPDAPLECGTTLWAHKKTRIRHNSHPDIMSTFRPESTLDKTPYEPVDIIGNVFNRLVIFDAGCIHSASEYFGFNQYNCRLWHMFFFD